MRAEGEKEGCEFAHSQRMQGKQCRCRRRLPRCLVVLVVRCRLAIVVVRRHLKKSPNKIVLTAQRGCLKLPSSTEEYRSADCCRVGEDSFFARASTLQSSW